MGDIAPQGIHQIMQRTSGGTGGGRAIFEAKTIEPFAIIGGRHRKVDALDRLTGVARYTDDLRLPRMLHCKILRSPHAHARIHSIDASAALAMQGVEAVIDKDLASALLAAELRADRFIISTDVDRVALDYGKPDVRWLDHISLDDAIRYHEENQFDTGSMGPKVQAMINYLVNGGSEGIITNPENLEQAILGEAGTHFVIDQDHG